MPESACPSARPPPSPALARAAEAELAVRVAAGDEAALERLHSLYFNKIYRYAFYRLNRDHQHTEEAVNDTFFAALDKIGQYNPSRGSLESWLVMLSRNHIRAINTAMFRPRDHEKSWSGMEIEIEELLPDRRRDAAPIAALEDGELGAIITSVMAGLAAENRFLLEAKYIRGDSVRDIALASGRTEKAVESQLTRARVAFREAFREVASGVLMELGI